MEIFFLKYKIINKFFTQKIIPQWIDSSYIAEHINISNKNIKITHQIIEKELI